MFQFSRASLRNLENVHPDLVEVAKRALELTEVDFGITQGVRSKSEQAELVEAGASKTMNSRHITGHAIDVVAYIGHRLSWDWPLYIKIAEAFREASIDLCVPVRWGGSWTALNDTDDLDEAVQKYVERKRKQGERPLLDGPHYELPFYEYPS